MNDIKREFRWFSIMDYEKEANYLSKRHQQGWKFHEAAFPGIYTFHKCEPENVVYQLDYNNAVKKNQREYVQMFEDCGWEYIQNFNGYCYFRKPMAQMQQKEEIFCDDVSRLDMMNRIFFGRVIPMIIILCGLIINVYDSVTSGREGLGLVIVFGVLLFLYIITFLQFAVKYFSFRKNIKI